VSGLVFVYNDQFNQRLATLADGIIPINAYGLIGEVIADPGLYGFSNVTGTACNIGADRRQLAVLHPGAYVSPAPTKTYLFAMACIRAAPRIACCARSWQATIMARGRSRWPPSCRWRSTTARATSSTTSSSA
jgi:hypothetical protein